MAEVGLLSDIFRRLVGGGRESVVPAPSMSSYPDSRDAEFARRYGFGYGTPLEPYIQGQRARVIGQPGFEDRRPTFVPGSVGGMSPGEATGAAVDDRQSRNLDLTDPANANVGKGLGTVLAQAALATNRMPIAALGFDPGRTGFDTLLKGSNIAGAYSPSSDAIFSNVSEREPSTPVHESIHRGMAQLRKDPALSDIFKNLPSEEMIVRYLMATQAGDPEKGGGSVGEAQRKSAIDYFNHPTFKSRYRKHLDELDRAASAALLARQPRMGPR
jgi:hypothetical protein